MKTLITTAVSTALATAGIALGGIVMPATACAAPDEWDVGAYDKCVASALKKYQTGQITFQQYNGSVKDCCWSTSGRWSDTQGCVAPPKDQAADSVLPTQTLTPVIDLPPGTITENLERVG